MNLHIAGRQGSMDAEQLKRGAWQTVARHGRRVVISAAPLVVMMLLTIRKNGVLETLTSISFAVVGIVLLCLGFERQIARHARMWRTFLVLESISILWFTLVWLIEWFGQSVRIFPADPAFIPTSVRGLVSLLWVSQFMLVWWVITYVFPYTTDDLRLRNLEVDRLRRAAELARLRSNLEPHFLLNTLNAIAGLVSEDPKEARRLIVALGDLLGDSLDDRETETLGEQIEWLRKYATILETRHRERLRVSWDVSENAQRIVVPRFLLQPLLENAVNHGALCRQEGGEVQVRAIVVDDDAVPTLLCEVEDNGPGLQTDTPRNGAKGLALVQARLEVMDVGARFRFEPAHPGTRAILELPVREGISSKGNVR
jgi:hypothetical protein